MTSAFLRRVVYLFSALTLFLAGSASANLQVYPTRMVLEDSKRVGHLTLRSLGDKPVTYQVKAVFFRMKKDGSFEEVVDAKDEERPLGKYLRFSPRSVELKPQQEQVIRVMYAGPGNLPDGEYRTHLRIEPMHDPKAGAETKKAANPDKIEMQLETLVSFAIPVLFRHGATQFESKLENLHVLNPADGTSTLAVDVNWKGNAFPYGDFEAFFTPKNGKRASVGLTRGVASYPSPRTVLVPLSLAKDKLHAGKLEVEFRASEEEGAKKIQSAETSVP